MLSSQAGEANTGQMSTTQNSVTFSDSGGKGKKKKKNRLADKSRAEVNLINQMWAEPAFPGIPPSMESPVSEERDRDRLKRSDKKVSASEKENKTAGQNNKDFNTFLEREYVRDLETARHFIQSHDDKLYAAASEAARGGTGSLAVLLSTLQTQVKILTSQFSLTAPVTGRFL